LYSLPSAAEKLEIAEVFAADQRKLKALDEFIAYKKKLVLRGFDPIRNAEVVDKMEAFKEYLEEFPQ